MRTLLGEDRGGAAEETGAGDSGFVGGDLRIGHRPTDMYPVAVTPAARSRRIVDLGRGRALPQHVHAYEDVDDVGAGRAAVAGDLAG